MQHLKRLLYCSFLISALLLALGASLGLEVASAHSSVTPKTIHRSNPNASGGGCSPWGIGQNVTQEACINYRAPYVQSDSYVSFHPFTSDGSITSCYVYIEMYNVNSGTDAASETFGCIDQARAGKQNVHFGTVVQRELSGTYRTTVTTTIKYQNGTTTIRIDTSPDLHVG